MARTTSPFRTGTAAFLALLVAGLPCLTHAAGAPVRINVGTSPSRAVVTPDGSEVYVANSGSGTVSVIGAATNTVLNTIPVGNTPDSLAVSPDGKKVYVGQHGGGIRVINTATKAVSTINVGTPVRDIAIKPDGSALYAAMEFGGLKRIDLATNAVTQANGTACPEAVVVTAGNRAYVNYQCAPEPGTGGHDPILVFDTTDHSQVGSIAFASPSVRMANVGSVMGVSPDGSQVWANGGDACISLLYDHAGCPAVPAGVLNVIRTSDNTVVKSLGFPQGVGHVTISPDSARAFVSTAALHVYDTAGFTLIRSFPFANAGKVAFAPGGRRAYVPVPAENAVMVLELEDDASATTALPPLTVPNSTWIAVQSRFSGDANNNGHTQFEVATSAAGPWTPACGTGTPGRLEWRWCTISGLQPASAYYVRVTQHDPDGVGGTNPQVVGPVHTKAPSSGASAIGSVSATVQDTHVLVSVLVNGDGNANGSLTRVEAATSAAGPWIEKCGADTSYYPKLCRVHGLTNDTAYFFRVTLADPDGVSGPATQIVGPVVYTGLTNLALGKAISGDPGWGCCSNIAELIDGRIQNPAWFHGYAWTGGNACWAGGCPAGFKQATVDLGEVQTVARVDWWTHDAGNVPLTWRVRVSTDGKTFQEVFSTSEPVCRTQSDPLTVNWAFPACGHSATFAPVTARYVRYSFDDRTLLGGIHGWAVELEVFAKAQPGQGANHSPVANAGNDRTVAVGATAQLDGSGSSDPDGDTLSYAWSFDAKPAGSAATIANPNARNASFVADRAGSYTLRLTVSDGRGGSNSDTVHVTTANRPPVPIIIGPKTVPVGATVNLNAADSSDPDGDPFTFAWTFASKPEGSNASIAGATTAKASFVADREGLFDVKLTLTDNRENKSLARHPVKALGSSACGPLPTANAGADQNGKIGKPVTLDGSGSRPGAPGGALILYRWTHVSGPAQPKITPIGNGERATFVAGTNGQYRVRLTVFDRCEKQASDEVVITLGPVPPLPSTCPNPRPQCEKVLDRPSDPVNSPYGYNCNGRRITQTADPAAFEVIDGFQTFGCTAVWQHRKLSSNAVTTLSQAWYSNRTHTGGFGTIRRFTQQALDTSHDRVIVEGTFVVNDAIAVWQYDRETAPASGGEAYYASCIGDPSASGIQRLSSPDTVTYMDPLRRQFLHSHRVQSARGGFQFFWELCERNGLDDPTCSPRGPAALPACTRD